MASLSALRVAAAFLLVGMGLLGTVSQAQMVPHRSYSTHDGLPSEDVTALAQTPDGLLWIGTHNGLAIYDGRRFRSVPIPDSIRQKQVGALFPTSDGSVWVGLGHDVMRVTPHGASEVFLLDDHHVSEIVQDGDTVHFVTDRAYWSLAPGQDAPTQTFLRFGDNIGMTVVWGGDLGPNGDLWLASASHGPARIRSNGEVTHPGREAFASERGENEQIYGVQFLGDGTALVAEGHRVYRYDPGEETVERVATVEVLPTLIEDPSGLVYVTDASRVLPYDPRTEAVLNPLDLPDDRSGAPTTVLRDRDGGLWVGTEAGLLHFPNPEVDHVTSIDGVKIRDGTGFRSAGGALWANTWGAGLFQLRPRRQQTAPGGLLRWVLPRSQDGRIHALGALRDAPGRRWYAWTRDAGWQNQGVAVGAVRGYVDSTGVGYFWHNDGLYRHVPSGETTESTRLRSWPLNESQHHLMGPAPNGDPILFDEGTVLRLRRPDGAVIDTIASVPQHAESQGRRLQIDASGGIWCPFRGGGLLRISMRTGSAQTVLPDVVVESVMMGADSLAMVNTTDGLYLLDAKTATEKAFVTTADGLLSNDINGTALVGDTLYVGHPTGVSLLPIQSVLDGPPRPHAVITGLEVNFDERPVHAEANWNAEERTVGFSYTGASLAHSDRVRYEVRLLPRDTTWNSTSRRFARYTDLLPGTYEFQVRARLDGRPAGPPAAYSFTIPPFFYETWWFRLLAAVLGIAMTIGGYRWRVYRLEQRQETLKAAVEDRTRELAAEKKKTEEQAKRLAELDEAKNRFFAHISHEFRTPLSLILSPLRSALDGERNGDVSFGHRQAHRMAQNAERLQRLIDQLLDLATLEAGRMELNRKPGDLGALVERTAEAYGSRAEQKNVELDVETPVDRMEMQFDPEKVETMVSNLVGNAVKFTPDGGHIRVCVDRIESASTIEPPDDVDSVLGAARIQVSDTGPGIPAEVQSQIFDRFEQAESGTTRGHEGTGLGLALTSELAKLHGGTVAVESTPGEGSRFTILLPLIPVAERTDLVDGPGRSSQREPAPDADRPRLDGPAEGFGDHVDDDAPRADHSDEESATVLVVEDNAEMRAYLREELSGHWHVLEAVDGDDGWTTVEEARPDLVVSDVMMPGTDGFDLCRRIKDDPEHRTIPVLLLTARAGDDATLEGLSSGADDYVSKPFQSEELIRRIENHLAARRHMEARYRDELEIESLGLVAETEEESFVESVIDAVGKHVSDPDFGVGDLAEEMALSRRQLTRRLKGAVGEAPGEVIRRLRIEHAKRLLQAQPQTVSEVAYAVGFRSPSSFSHSFKDEVGETPTEYLDRQSE